MQQYEGLGPIVQYCAAVWVVHSNLDEKYTWVKMMTPPSLAQSCTLDTGQTFKKGRPKAYFFKAYTKVTNPKVGSFLRTPEDF